MSALFCLFLCFRSYSEKLEEYIPIFYQIRYILEELYVAVIWIISRLIIYIDQLNAGIVSVFNIYQSFSYVSFYQRNSMTKIRPSCAMLCHNFFGYYVYSIFAQFLTLPSFPFEDGDVIYGWPIWLWTHPFYLVYFEPPSAFWCGKKKIQCLTF